MVNTRRSRTPSVEPQGVNPATSGNMLAARPSPAVRSPPRNRRKSPSPAPVRRTHTKRDAATPVVESRAEPAFLQSAGRMVRRSRSRSASRRSRNEESAGGSAQVEESTRRLLAPLPEDSEAQFTHRNRSQSYDVGERPGRAPSEYSMAPSTAGFTTGSQMELRELDSGLICDFMSQLEEQADQILKLLILDDLDQLEVRSKLRQPGHETAQRFDTYEGWFKTTKKHFTSAEYIRPDIVEGTLGTDRYSPVLFKANLAGLACSIFTAQEESPVTRQKLMEIQKLFPGFIGHNIDDNSINVALNLRTHTLILSLAHHENEEHYDPLIFLAGIFLDDKGQGGDFHSLLQNGRLRRWTEWIDEDEDTEWKRTAAMQRMEDILDTYQGFPGVVEGVDFEKLSEKFPWEDFVEEIVDYIRASVIRLEKAVNVKELANEARTHNALDFSASRGRGAAAASEALQRAVGTNEKPFLPSTVKTHEQRRKSLNEQVVKHVSDFTVFKNLERRRASERRDGNTQNRPSSPPLEIDNVPHDDLPALDLGDNGDQQLQSPEQTPPPRGSNGDEMAAFYVTMQREVMNKENHKVASPARRQRFIDRQPNAERLEFRDSQELADSQPRRVDKGKKRAAPEYSDEFEYDVRHENPERRKRSRQDVPAGTQEARAQFAVRRHRQSGNASSSSRQTQALIRRDEASPSNSQSQAPRRAPSAGENVMNGEYEEDEAEDGALVPRRESYQTIRAAANREKAAAPPRYEGRKGRTRWSDRATWRLVMAIAEFGPKWAYIRDLRYPELAGQTNVMLKDKARIIKVNWMLSKLRLPPHFSDVGLGEKEVQRIHRVHPDMNVDNYPEVEIADGEEFVLGEEDIPAGVA